MPGVLLEFGHAPAYVIQQAKCHGMAFGVGDVLCIPGEVADHFVDTVDAQGGEVIAQGAQIALGVGEQPGIHVLLDHLALDLQTVAAQLQQAVQCPQQGHLVAPVQIAQAGTVDGDHAQRAGLLGRAEQAVAALEQFAQIQLQTAAHGAHHVRLQLRVEEVLKVGQAVLRSHGEQALGVVAVPREVMGDVVGRDRKGEHPSPGIALAHDLDVGAVDQVHFRLQLAVAEGHFLTADHRHLLAQIIRTDPVEGQVGEGSLGAPARGDVEVVDQLLDMLAYLRVVELVFAHIGSHVGIEGAEGLGARPFVLQGTEEIDDLPYGAGHVPWRGRIDLSGNAIESFIEQGAQGPAGTVAAEHVQIVDMQVAFTVSLTDLPRIDMAEPVVGDHLAGAVENQPAEGVSLVGVSIHSPVLAIQVLVYGAGDIQQSAVDGRGYGRRCHAIPHVLVGHAGQDAALAALVS